MHAILNYVNVVRAYLNTGFAQFQSHGKLFSGENVGVLGFFKSLLQLVELVCGKSGTRPANFSWRLLVLRRSLMWVWARNGPHQVLFVRVSFNLGGLQNCLFSHCR